MRWKLKQLPEQDKGNQIFFHRCIHPVLLKARTILETRYIDVLLKVKVDSEEYQNQIEPYSCPRERNQQ